jgi:hypothetical protein
MTESPKSADDSTDTETDSQLASEKSIEEVYADRNALALGFAALARSLGMDAGWYEHDDWAVIYVELPTGQVSWHVRRATVPEWLPKVAPAVYDGHDRRAKNDRLVEAADSMGRLAREAQQLLEERDLDGVGLDEMTLGECAALAGETAERAGVADSLDLDMSVVEDHRDADATGGSSSA